MTSDWVIGLTGARLTDDERRWLRQSPPLGVIVFARNIVDAAQVSHLLDEVRQQTGRSTWAAIDEEGGRIYRMPFPPFNGRASAQAFGQYYQQDADAAVQRVYDDALNTAHALKSIGFTHNCAPVLDVFHPEAHAIIGNRSYGDTVENVLALATACMQGLHDGGIAAIGKHYPGHGRAAADSHHALPVVDASLHDVMAEAAVFEQMVSRGLAHVMTAHVRYPAFDSQIASFSQPWLQRLREQGFDGTFWSDDLCMKGAGESLVDAIQQSRRAGCNALLICDPAAVAASYAMLVDAV